MGKGAISLRSAKDTKGAHKSFFGVKVVCNQKQRSFIRRKANKLSKTQSLKQNSKRKL
jgi:hypothetical protein